MEHLSTYAVARIYRKAYSKLAESCRGGMRFGMDIRTMFVVCPYWAGVLVKAHSELKRRQLVTFTTVSA